MQNLDDLIAKMDEDFKKHGNHASLVHKRLVEYGLTLKGGVFWDEFIRTMDKLYR